MNGFVIAVVLFFLGAGGFVVWGIMDCLKNAGEDFDE